MPRPPWSLRLKPLAKTSLRCGRLQDSSITILYSRSIYLVHSALPATLWFQLANYSQKALLKTKGLLTCRGQLMVPTAAKLWV